MPKILIVDDEQDLCEILSFNLQSEGYETDSVNSAEEALERVESGERRVESGERREESGKWREESGERRDMLSHPEAHLSSHSTDNAGETPALHNSFTNAGETPALHNSLTNAGETPALHDSGIQSLGHSYDLILLDVMMDRMSGYDFARLLREHGDRTPIIFLTARDSHDDEMLGFGVGADDYITKPFSFDTVLARVKAVLRRSGERRVESGERRVESGEWRVESGERRTESLTKREYMILELFRQHQGRYFTREEILHAVWPGDALVGERSVDVHIARLRKKLGADGSRIVNKTGFGYGLV